ncbi:MAG TPA: hypothetical protein VKZ41_04865 [Gemmatimonadales bacterium]|nr:hypothetical protein [Gemmatimonadales bacterium]
MWSDLLFLAERAHLGRLLAWGSGSLLVGTLIILLALVRRRGQFPLLLNFGVVTGGWGLVHVAIAMGGLRALQMRDLAGFTRYDRSLWFALGLDIGLIGVGVALAVCGWVAERSPRFLGAGTATIAQGLALLVLHAAAISTIFRLIAPG